MRNLLAVSSGHRGWFGTFQKNLILRNIVGIITTAVCTSSKTEHQNFRTGDIIFVSKYVHQTTTTTISAFRKTEICPIASSLLSGPPYRRHKLPLPAAA